MSRELRINLRVTLLVVIAAGLSLLSACVGTKAASGPPPPVPVLAATVEQKDIPIQVHAIGAVEAYSTVSVKTQITGELTGVFFKEGDDVKKGQLIFTLDKRPLEADVRRAEGALARDEAQAANALTDQRRFEALVKAGVVSTQEYDRVASNSEALAAAVRADKGALENAKVQLVYASIYSPINGRTGNLLVHQGNMIKANDVPALVNINQVEPIYVTFMVPQQYLAEVKQYSRNGSLPVQAVIPSDSRGPITGKLSFIDNMVDAGTGTIKLKGVFANNDRRLWPGQFVDAYLTLKTQSNALVIPSQAIQNGQQGTFVYVIKDDNTVEARTITTSETQQAGQVIVQKGLAVGERIVTDGQLRLVPGAKVQIKQAAAPLALPADQGSRGGS
ncbi:MAG TPA: efflux RND transporter periplasmic adaptor subunit [Terriglobales bacterium]